MRSLGRGDAYPAREGQGWLVEMDGRLYVFRRIYVAGRHVGRLYVAQRLHVSGRLYAAGRL